MHEGVAMLIGRLPRLVYSDGPEANVFLDRMPALPDRCVAVYLQSSGEPDVRLPYDPVEIQVVTRSEANPAWAIETMRTIYARLHGLRNVSLPDGAYAAFIIAQSGSPFSLGDDENGRPRYALDFRGERLTGGTSTQERSP